MNILFFGSDYYSTIALEYLIDNRAKICGVVTGTQKGSMPFPYSTVAEISRKNAIPTVEIKTKDELIKAKNILSSWNAEIGFVASFGVIIPRQIFDLPLYGTLNLHPSLLPRYRGPSPLEQSILDNTHTSGVTIMRIDEGVDTGDIVSQQKAVIYTTDTTLTLAKRFYPMGTHMFLDLISRNPNGTFRETTQNHKQATQTKRYKKSDARIDLNLPASIIDAHVRAYYPKPLSWTTLYELVQHYSNKTPLASWQEKRVIIHKGLNKNNVYTPTHVQVEGKNSIDWKTFCNGYL